MAEQPSNDQASAAPASTIDLARGMTSPGARFLAMTGYVIALVSWSWLIGIPNDIISIVIWGWLATIAWNIGAPWRYHLNFIRDWSLPVGLLIVYFFSRGLADELIKLPVEYTMPIDFDRWLFGGTTPTETLQDAWCGDPCLRSSDPAWYDLLFTTTYATHFVTGLTLAVVLWLYNRRVWVLWMRRYVAMNLAGLVIYILYPMAPPWMASEEGYMGEVTRITGRGWQDIGLQRVDVILQGVGNPVAAMPSLHAGIAFLVAFFAIWRLRSPLRWLILAYPLLMCLALVYYAEHYVIDEIAGALLAGAVMVGCSWWERRQARKRAVAAEEAAMSTAEQTLSEADPDRRP